MARARDRESCLKWFEELPCSVTVCDRNYKILYMNDRAAETTADDGGRELIGKNLLDCHPPKARKKLKEVMASTQPNIYTSEKKGVKKMVFQGQWRKNGRVGGLVELYFELPGEIPNFERK
jgi:transcriptional regulator with PAS, ATPase and Fis domain